MPEQPVVPANPGWFAVYREAPGFDSYYPVIAWVAEDKGHAVVVTEDDLVHTNTIKGKFLGFRHERFMPFPGSVMNSRNMVRRHDDA